MLQVEAKVHCDRATTCVTFCSRLYRDARMAQSQHKSFEIEVYYWISVIANLIHSSKSSNYWNQNHLRPYNTQVIEQSLVEFFNQNQLPSVPPTVRHFGKTMDRALARDDDTYKLLHYLDLV